MRRLFMTFAMVLTLAIANILALPSAAMSDRMPAGHIGTYVYELGECAKGADLIVGVHGYKFNDLICSLSHIDKDEDGDFLRFICNPEVDEFTLEAGAHWHIERYGKHELLNISRGGEVMTFKRCS